MVTKEAVIEQIKKNVKREHFVRCGICGSRCDGCEDYVVRLELVEKTIKEIPEVRNKNGVEQ